MNIRYAEIASPVGSLLAARDDHALIALHFTPHAAEADWTRDDNAFDDLREQLHEYFAGTRQSFDLALDPRGTDFQRSVWAALRRIPFGETTTYSRIAETIARPAAVRAVGSANGANPLPIVIPCHRVIGANGSLTGFGGGLDTKRFLLDHEARVAGRRLF